MGLWIAVILSFLTGMVMGYTFGWWGLLISIPIAIALGMWGGSFDNRRTRERGY